MVVYEVLQVSELEVPHKFNGFGVPSDQSARRGAGLDYGSSPEGTE